MAQDRTTRDAAIDAFLAKAGWGGVQRSSLADDASFRRYERVQDGFRRAVLMDAPPDKEVVRPFVTVAGLLAGVDLSAPEILAAYDAALDALRLAGAQVLPIELPSRISDMADPLGHIIYAEGYAHYAHLIDDPAAPLDEDVRPRLATGARISSKDHVLALRAQQRVIREFHAALAPVDVLLTPTTVEPAPLISEIDQTKTPALFTRMVNMAEMCACAVPIGMSAGGLPLSAQFVAAYGAEDLALRAAWGYEQASGFEVGVPEGFK